MWENSFCYRQKEERGEGIKGERERKRELVERDRERGREEKREEGGRRDSQGGCALSQGRHRVRRPMPSKVGLGSDD